MAPNHPEGFLNLVSDAKKRIKEEDFRETKKRLDAGEKIHSHRYARRFRMGARPHSRRDSSGQGHHRARHRENRSGQRRHAWFSIAAADFARRSRRTILQKMGYRNVISMDGGWRGWTEAGFPDHSGLAQDLLTAAEESWLGRLDSNQHRPH